jgi:GxxExxY protein
MRDEPDTKVDQLAKAVIGSAIEVHRMLGPGYLESIYEEALSVALKLQSISFERQKIIGLRYKGHPVGEGRLDFLIDGCLIVELKAVESFSSIHKAQVISYLKATRLTLGLLLNFNVPILKDGLKRIVLSTSNGVAERTSEDKNIL